MFGLAENVDLSFFRDREVLQVCIGWTQAQIHLDGNVSLFIETEMRHRSRAGPVVQHTDIRASAVMLASLLGLRVLSAKREPPGTLVLEFSDGSLLEVLDSSPRYESYQIKYADQLIVV
jgi:hypothetical protein